MRKLSLRQEKFIFEYLSNGLNATNAAMVAGYSSKSAEVTASRLLRNAMVKQKISEFGNNLAESSGITVLRVIDELRKIAFGTIDQIFDDWAVLKPFDELSEDAKSQIQQIRFKVTKRSDSEEVEYIQIKCHNKLRALGMLIKILGFEAPTRRELTGKDGNDLIESTKIDLSLLSSGELEMFLRLVEKAYGIEDKMKFLEECQN